MKLELSEEQVMLQDVVGKLLAKHGTLPRLSAAEPLGFDAALWDEVWELGIPLLRAPDAGEASVLHALVVAEEAGRHLASVPLIEAIVARRLLAQLAPAACPWLDAAREGQDVIALASEDLGKAPGQILASGAVAQAVLGLEGDALWVWHDLGHGDLPKIHGSIPACRLSALTVGARQRIDDPDAARLFRAALEELRLLTAAQLAAAGQQAVQDAADYAGGREAFGRKIGEFQGLSHPLANVATDLEGARLLCWRAVDAIARGDSIIDGDAGAGAMVAMAHWWAGVAARSAALVAMRVFGGYGMTTDYPAQLFFRRINGWSLVGGTPDAAMDLIAARLWRGAPADLPEAGDTGITFGWGEEGEAAAARMREFCERRHSAELAKFMRESLDGFDRELHQELAEVGLLHPDAPVEFGGPGLKASTAAAVRDVFGSYYWNLLAPSITDMIAKTVLHFGSETARQEILPDLYAGRKYCTLGYSEPSGGSDIFAARVTATRDGDDWLINGQKQFTSTAHLADYALMVTRTGPDKHRGITMFIVPLKQEGFALNEIKTIGDERTNATFYDNVRVPDAYRIGEVNGGVKVLAAALAIEQSSGDLHVMSMRNLLRGALAWAQSEADGPAPITRPEVARALADTATRLVIQDTLNRHAIWAQEVGQSRKHYGPMAKLFGSESWTSTSARLLEVAAPASLEVGLDGVAAIEFMLRRAIPSTIYAGSSEIQRSIIAEAGLGMPRSR